MPIVNGYRKNRRSVLVSARSAASSAAMTATHSEGTEMREHSNLPCCGSESLGMDLENRLDSQPGFQAGSWEYPVETQGLNAGSHMGCAVLVGVSEMCRGSPCSQADVWRASSVRTASCRPDLQGPSLQGAWHPECSGACCQFPGSHQRSEIQEPHHRARGAKSQRQELSYTVGRGGSWLSFRSRRLESKLQASRKAMIVGVAISRRFGRFAS